MNKPKNIYLVIGLDVGTVNTGLAYRAHGTHQPNFGTIVTKNPNQDRGFPFPEFIRQIYSTSLFHDLIHDIKMLQVEYEDELGILLALESPSPGSAFHRKRRERKRRHTERENTVWPQKHWSRAFHDLCKELNITFEAWSLKPHAWRSTLKITTGCGDEKRRAIQYVETTYRLSNLPNDHVSDAICIHDAAAHLLQQLGVRALAR